MVNLKCSECGLHTVQGWTRKSGRVDYRCTACGSKLNPVQESRVLVIGDLHAPFIKDGYLDFVSNIYDRYNCNTVVQIGDILDNHYSSFHDTDPDGWSANVEFRSAMLQLTELADMFPNMHVMEGNHDAIPNRRAFNAGLSTRWMRSTKEVMLEAGLPVEGWNFQQELVLDGVKYTHGIGRQAKQRMTQDGISIVQGHYHSRSSIDYLSNQSGTTFGMQIGCGIDDSAYAFAYGRHFAASHINCGVVVGGTTPILEYFNSYNEGE